MELRELITKLEKAIVSFIENQSFDSLKNSIGEHFFEDNRDAQWSNEDDYFQIEFEVLDKWTENQKEVVFVVADATDGFQKIGTELLFPESEVGYLSKAIYKYKNGVPECIDRGYK